MASSNRLINLESWLSTEYERFEYRLQALLGRRALTIALLAVVLALAAVDMAALGAMASALESALHIGNASFGLISTTAALTGALVTLPVGILVDRQPRVPMLAVLTGLWSIGMALSAFIQGYTALLLAQILVGVSGISVGAVIASLTGDYFPPSQRGRIFGLIVGGEMIGGGLGMLVASLAIDAFSWRAAFLTLAVAGIVLTWLIVKYLHEPERSGMTSISRESVCEGETDAEGNRQRVSNLILSRNITPHQDRVIRRDPTHWSWDTAARYILSIRTNQALLIGSTSSYFYYNGLLTFGVLYLMLRFGLGSGLASLLFLITGSGGIAGVLLSGWLADWLLRRRIIAARVWVSAGAFFIAVTGFIPAFLFPEILPASAFFFLAALGLSATNPPLDAARLDVMHSRLWGRAESLRNALRYIPVAVAPYFFGLVSEVLVPSTGSNAVRHGAGLEMTFLLMLILLLISGAAMLVAALTYPRDVATAVASEQASADPQPPDE